jgi:hypothetical protein
VLQSLAVFEPGAAALLASAEGMLALRQLRLEGTVASAAMAAAALFALEGGGFRARSHCRFVLLLIHFVPHSLTYSLHLFLKRQCDQTLGGLPVKHAPQDAAQVEGKAGAAHVMMSYDWTHQSTVLRVVKALQGRGYDVWLDVEQTNGSTLDAMAMAVEDAEVVLIGVSKAYKESTNCRIEAQYAMQRQKELIPLQLEEHYRADGWLGLMMGSRLWHPPLLATPTPRNCFWGPRNIHFGDSL